MNDVKNNNDHLTCHNNKTLINEYLIRFFFSQSHIYTHDRCHTPRAGWHLTTKTNNYLRIDKQIIFYYLSISKFINSIEHIFATTCELQFRHSKSKQNKYRKQTYLLLFLRRRLVAYIVPKWFIISPTQTQRRNKKTQGLIVRFNSRGEEKKAPVPVRSHHNNQIPPTCGPIAPSIHIRIWVLFSCCALIDVSGSDGGGVVSGHA